MITDWLRNKITVFCVTHQLSKSTEIVTQVSRVAVLTKI